MSNQMKKILLTCLIFSYCVTGVLFIILIAKMFVYKYIFEYVLLVFNVALCVYFQYLWVKIKKQDLLFNSKVADAKKLLQLREFALLDFYISRGIIPQYNKDGKLLTPDELLSIVQKLNPDGSLDKTIYELLGIEPRFDVNGKELPTILVLKHLMGKPRTKDFIVVQKFAKLHTNPKTIAKNAINDKVKAKVAQRLQESSAKKGGSSKPAPEYGHFGEAEKPKIEKKKANTKKDSGIVKQIENKVNSTQEKPTFIDFNNKNLDLIKDENKNTIKQQTSEVTLSINVGEAEND